MKEGLSPTPSVPPKTIPGAPNMKKGLDVLGSAENESLSAKHENGTDAFGTVENESGSTKHENVTQRPWYRQK
jgi:hypothetical protein